MKAVLLTLLLLAGPAERAMRRRRITRPSGEMVTCTGTSMNAPGAPGARLTTRSPARRRKE